MKSLKLFFLRAKAYSVQSLWQNNFALREGLWSIRKGEWWRVLNRQVHTRFLTPLTCDQQSSRTQSPRLNGRCKQWWRRLDKWRWQLQTDCCVHVVCICMCIYLPVRANTGMNASIYPACTAVWGTKRNKVRTKTHRNFLTLRQLICTMTNIYIRTHIHIRSQHLLKYTML